MEYWLRMGGPNGITLLAWLILSPISIFFTAVVLPEGRLPGASIWAGFLVGTLSHVATGVVLLLAKYTILRNTAQKPRPITTLSTFAFAGLVRGFSTAYLLEAFGIAAQADYADRMRSGAILVLIWFAVSAVMVDGIRNYRRGFEALSEELEREQTLKFEGQKELAQTQASLTEQIRETLAEALRHSSTPKDIHRAVDDLVRPLAHSINRGAGLVLNTAVAPKRRIRLGPVFRTALNEVPFNPLWVSLVAVLATIYSRFWQFGWVSIIDSAATTLVITIVFLIARRLKIRGLWSVFVWFLTGLSAASITALLTDGLLPESFYSVLYLSVNVMAPAMLIASIGAFDREANKNLDRLRGVVELIRWQRSSIEQREWVQRQRIARFVHSELQAKLRAFALRMDFAGRMPAAQEIEELRQDCERSILAESRQQSFEDFFLDVTELWGGVLDVELDADDKTLAQLAADPYCTAAVIEVVREGLSNAVKHGKATRARVSLVTSDDADRSFLTLEIRNDGVAPSTTAEGFGLSSISELASEYSLDRVGGETRLRAELTIAPDLVGQL